MERGEWQNRDWILANCDLKHIPKMAELQAKDRMHSAIAARMLVRPRGAPAETALASSQGSGTHSPEDTRVPDVYVAAASGTHSPEDARGIFRRSEQNAL